ncbi:MAG: cupin domain-containing protein [Acidimicrobiia bacterium]
MSADPIRLAKAFEEFTDQWSPKAIASMNDYLVKLVRVEGEFVWHTHEDTDELFLVVEGELLIDLKGTDSVTLTEGDLFVVPAGTQHRPRASAEAKVLLLEPATVVNTGDAGDSDLTSDVEWLRQ